MRGEAAERLAWLTLQAEWLPGAHDPGQPKRAVALWDAAERSRKSTFAVYVSWGDEDFTYRAGRLESYSHPIAKRLVRR